MKKNELETLIDKKLNYLQEEIINERIDIYLDEFVVTFSTVVSSAMVLSVILNVYKTFLSKGARKCSDYAGSAKSICLLNVKKDAAKQAILKAQQGKTKCKTVKDPKICIEKINIKIKDFKNKIADADNRLRELKSYNIG